MTFIKMDIFLIEGMMWKAKEYIINKRKNYYTKKIYGDTREFLA